MKAGVLWGTVLGVLLWVPLSVAQRMALPAGAPPPVAPSKASLGPQAAQGPSSPTASPDRGKRRDPFHTLIPPRKPATEQQAAPTRLPPGKRGLVIEQLQLQGIVRGIDGGWFAVVDNKTKRAYFLHEKDEVYNGVVSKITADTVVFLESSTDSSGKAVSREVVKKLSAE